MDQRLPKALAAAGLLVTREDVLAPEVAQDAITMNVQGMLGGLSESTGGLALSSLAVVKRTESVAEGALESRDPLRNGNSRIVPFVGEPEFVQGETVSLFLVAYPGPEAGRPTLSLGFSRDGELVARSSAELPAADGEGRIPYVASVPTARLSPGRYEVAASVQQGVTAARERAFFTVSTAPSN